jgi:hypothetical protein
MNAELPVPDQPEENPLGWDGVVDTQHEAGRGRGRRIPYDAIPTECAMMVLYAAPRRFTGPKFWVKLASETEARHNPYYLSWEDGIPMLRANYVTVSINAAGRPHIVYASTVAWHVAKAVKDELARQERANSRL